MRDGEPIKLLLDTGAATSLISSRRANDLRLKTYDTSPVTIRGATTNARGVPCTKATVLTFTHNAIQYEIPIYVGDELHIDIIIGNPVLEFYHELGQITTNMSPVTLEPPNPQTFVKPLTPQNYDTPSTTPNYGEPQQQPLTCPIGIINTEDDRQVRKARKKPSKSLTGYIVQVQVVDYQPSEEPVEESTFKLLLIRSPS